MRFRRRNEPIRAFPTSRADHSFENRIGLRTSGRGFAHGDAESGDRLIQMSGKNAISIVD